MTGDQVLDGVVEEIPGLEGTDLECAHNLQGDNLVLRVNKGSVLVFRAMLRNAVLAMLESRLVHFNSSPRISFSTIGDTEEGLRRMLLAAGIVDDPPAPRHSWLAWLGRAS